jgi:hypothetical protein
MAEASIIPPADVDVTAYTKLRTHATPAQKTPYYMQ